MPEDKESPYLHIVKTAHYFERFWPPASRFEQLSYTIKKTPHKEVLFFIGELGRVRTADPLIKSQMLYRLSYEPVNGDELT